MTAGISHEFNNILTAIIGYGEFLKDEAGQIEQVMINLATNARDAMPQGGRITIETGIGEREDDHDPSDKKSGNRPYAFISVSDVGIGMDSNTREQIFEPFFTTKDPGKGTGLGLSVVYGIVRQHDGFVNVISELSKGSTFRVYLPLFEPQGEETNG